MKPTELDMLIVILTLIILTVILMMAMIYVFYVKKKSQLILSRKEKDIRFQQELSLAQIEMREITLNYIGQELHDDIGQKLSVARLMNNQAIQQTKEYVHVNENLKEINELLGESIQDIRNMSKTFITDQVEHFGLIDTLELEVRRIAKLKLIDVDFQFNIHDIDINPKDGLIIFRILQESINNVLKHARAERINIIVQDTPAILKVKISDNGVGINNEKKRGSGLNSMRKRALMIGADLQIDSTKDIGTELKLIYTKR